ncbi:MAG: hypothetical protein EOO63_13125, partial [Hymenobacter sp.]
MKKLALPIQLGILLALLAGLYFTVLAFSSDSKPAPEVGAEAALAAVPKTGPAKPVGTARPAFNYLPPAPVGGKLRGVVELGASGFNCFIVTTDNQSNWQLNKAEFDNSLLLENLASDEEIRRGLRTYIGNMLDYGVAGRDIHFVVSSGALKGAATPRIVQQLSQMGYVVNT